MKEFSSNPKVKTLKLVSVLLMATFLQAGIARSEGGLGGALGGLGGGGGLGGALGGAVGSVGDTVGGLTGGLSNTASGATNGINTPTTKLGTVSVNPDDEVGANANSQLINGINAKARFLNPDQLANLCMAAGGGASGCSGSTTEVRAALNANLQNLSSGQLASLCAGVGCNSGNAAVPIGSNPIGGGSPGGTNGLGGANGLGGMSRGEVVAYKKRCVNVLRAPQRYESDIVSLCRLIKRQRV